jgi:hypothetical protein
VKLSINPPHPFIFLYPEGILYNYPHDIGVFPVSLTLTDTIGMSSNYNYALNVLPVVFHGVIINESSTDIATAIKFPLPNKIPKV